MKKFVVLASLLATTSAMADDFNDPGRRNHDGEIAISVVLGAVILASIFGDHSRSAPPPPPPRSDPHGPSHDGNYIYRPSEPPVGPVRPRQPEYKFVDVYIPECRCYRSVMVQIP